MKILSQVFQFEWGNLYYWNHPKFLFPDVLGNFDTKFRKSVLLQGSEYLYGDNSVRHWRMSGDYNSYVEDEEGHAIFLGQELETHYSGDSWYRTCTFTYADASLGGFLAYYGMYCTENRYGEWGRKTCVCHRIRSEKRNGELWCVIDTVETYAHLTVGLTPHEFVAYAESLPDWYIWEEWLALDLQHRPSNPDISFQKIAYVSTPFLPADIYNWMDRRRNESVGNLNSVIDNLIRDTIQEETTLNTNNYANLSEAMSLVRDMASGKWNNFCDNVQNIYRDVLRANGTPVDWGRRITPLAAEKLRKEGRRALRNKAAKYAGDAWLKYRYAYNTTKMDIEQATSVIVNDKLKPLVPERVLRGEKRLEDGYVRVKMRLHEMTAPSFTSLLINSDKVGLMPGLYNAWDMVPFSFVVDWFYPVGDILQDMDQQMFYRYYRVDELLITICFDKEIDEGWGHTTYRWYDRILLDDWPDWSAAVDNGSASERVSTYRMTDSLVLSNSIGHERINQYADKKGKRFERQRRRLLRK